MRTDREIMREALKWIEGYGAAIQQGGTFKWEHLGALRTKATQALNATYESEVARFKAERNAT